MYNAVTNTTTTTTKIVSNNDGNIYADETDEN